MRPDRGTLADLTAFARLELEAGDVEPWAAVIGALHAGVPAFALDVEQALWLVKLYNAYDDLGSAWTAMQQWPSAGLWHRGHGKDAAATLWCGRERRNLRGGLVVKHLDSYTAALNGRPQLEWLREACATADRFANFGALMPYLRRVWGTGRLSAFEWAEFTAKVAGLPVETTDACLWESSGPRQALERLYGNDDPDRAWLDAAAHECKAALAADGVDLTWWDFETVICDFNVMRKGRYYPGQHIAMIREEIESQPEPARGHLRHALTAVIPEPWCRVAPGVDKQLAAAYRDTGTIRTPKPH